MQRRLAAILAADVVGYTRLMGADEAGTLRRLTGLREEVLQPIIENHNGRIVKLMGDGVLVEFASAVEAVCCAVAWQESVVENQSGSTAAEPLQFRIGINLGDIIVEKDDIYGEGVNIAARLEGLASPGGICLSEDVYRQARGKVGAKFVDLGARDLKNVAAAVRVFRISTGEGRGQNTSSDKPGYLEGGGGLPLPDKPSIAILPFDNLSSDPDQEFFADGIAEDIITLLSKFHSLFVIARNSSFAFKQKSVDVRQIGRTLGVRYVLEGSVRKAGNRVRITAQLIDASEDRHLWAHRYDRDLEDIFAVQDEVTLAVVAAIEPQLNISERKRALRKPPENLDAWENYQRGLWHTFQYGAEDRDVTLPFFERAIELDPNFASAHAGLGYALYVYILVGGTPDREADLARALAASQTAIRLDEQDPFGWVSITRGHILRGEHEAAINASDRAISLNPNLALAHFGRAHALWHAGRPGEAIQSHDDAIRFSPNDPILWAYLASKAIALVMLQDYEQAIEVSLQSQRLANSAIFAHLAELSALGQLGKTDQAADALGRARAKKADLSLSFIAQALPISDPDCRKTFHDGLRSAGVPE
ncbi:MAG: adenylate/guanylate cyclase domain-containing protein [Pseudomonadota bacterium]